MWSNKIKPIVLSDISNVVCFIKTLSSIILSVDSSNPLDLIYDWPEISSVLNPLYKSSWLLEFGSISLGLTILSLTYL